MSARGVRYHPCQHVSLPGPDSRPTPGQVEFDRSPPINPDRVAHPAAATMLPIRRCETLEQHVVDVGEGLDVSPLVCVLSLALRRLAISPVAAQSFPPRSTPNPVSNTGTTMTVGSLGSSLYTVEEMTGTLTPVSVVQMSPRRGNGSTLR